MEFNEETRVFSLTIRNCVMEDKGIYTIEIMEFVKKDEAAFCDCIVDIEGTISHFDILLTMITEITPALFISYKTYPLLL